MHWLVILLLVGFVIRQGLVLKRIEDRLDAALKTSADRQPKATQPVETPVQPRRPEPTPARRPAVSVAEVRRPETVRAPEPHKPEPRRPEPAPVPPRAAPRPPVSTWLAENGLAWIGGGGLALGGLLLVVYAAQQGVFTPPFRIAAAVILGAAMIAASEWILRQTRIPGGRHLLAAAVAAGAGAVTLYGAVCAAYTLYELIPFAAAAVLTGVISLGLLGLALRHGEPLALLAILGAVLTPWVTGISAWSPTVLVSWALLIGVTGYVIGAARMWTRASLVTLAGLLAWSLVEAFGGGALLLLLAATGPACAVLWRRANRRDDPADPRHRTFLQMPAIALVVTSLVSSHLWFNGLEGAAHLPEAVLIAGALVALAAAIIARGMAPAMIFAAPVGMAVICALLNLVVFSGRPDFAALLPWFYGLTGVIPVATLVAALRAPAPARTALLGVGGIGVAVLASVSWLLLDWVGLALSWLPAALLGAAMFATAGLIARRVEQVLSDRGLVFWLAAAAELSFLAIHAAIPAPYEPVAFALAAVFLAAAAHRLAWSGLARASVAGGLIALAVMFHPEFIGAALEGRLSLSFALTVSFTTSALLFAAARTMRGPRAPNRTEAEAQSTAALMVLLTGLFIGLHVILTGTDPEAASGGLFEAGLRTVVLLSAGLLLVVRQREDHGPIARARTLVVVGAGLVHGLLVQGLAWNPWWGAGAAPLGLPVINTLMISFLAPALLLAASAGRRRPMDHWTRIWAAAAITFAFLWIVLVLRHLFQDAAMGEAGIGRAEGCAYAVLLLLTARLFARQGLGTRVGLGDGLRRAAVPLGWAALAFAVLTFGFLASPWWGPQTEPLASVPAAGLLFGLYALGAVTMLGLRQAEGPLGQAATAATVGILFALMTLLIRWGFHGGAMAGATPGGGLETWTFSALWAVFGLATLCLGTARHDVAVRWAGLAVLLFTAAKVLFFDLARLEGVTRAASFLAVGALFLAGALVARRLNTRNPDAGSS